MQGKGFYLSNFTVFLNDCINKFRFAAIYLSLFNREISLNITIFDFLSWFLAGKRDVIQ